MIVAATGCNDPHPAEPWHWPDASVEVDAAPIINADAADAGSVDAVPVDAAALDAQVVIDAPVDAPPPIDAPAPIDAPPPIDAACDATPPDASVPVMTTLSSTPNLTIPDDQYVGVGDGNDGFGSDAGMTCNTINVTTVPAGHAVQNVEIELSMIHTWVGDVTVKLRSPSGTILALIERPQGDHGTNNTGDSGQNGPSGDSSNLDGTAIEFADGNPDDAETLGASLNTAQAVCTDDGRCAFAANPDQAGVLGASVANFAGFIGDAAAGPWTLCAADSSPGDGGTLVGWTLILTSQ